MLQETLWCGPVGFNLPRLFFLLANDCVLKLDQQASGASVAFVCVPPGDPTSSLSVHLKEWMNKTGSQVVCELLLPGRSGFCSDCRAMKGHEVARALVGVRNFIRAVPNLVFCCGDDANSLLLSKWLVSNVFPCALIVTDGQDEDETCVSTKTNGWKTEAKKRMKMKHLTVDNSALFDVDQRKFDYDLTFELSSELSLPPNTFRIDLSETCFTFGSVCLSATPSANWVLFYHGNGESVAGYTSIGEGGFCAKLSEMDWNVICVEYRGRLIYSCLFVCFFVGWFVCFFLLIRVK